MEILDRIQKDHIQAMKERNEIKANTLNMLRSQIKYKEIELKGTEKELQESDVIEIIRKEIKKREEAIEMYKSAGRADLLEKEEKELDILNTYMPKPISEDEIREEIKKIIKEMHAGKGDFGKVMKAAMERFKGAVPGNKIKEIVESELK